MSWQLAVGASLVFSTVYALVFREFARKNEGKGPAVVALSYLLFVSPIGLIVAFVLGDISLSFDFKVWVFLVVGGALFTAANFSAFYSSTYVDAAQFAVVSNFRAISTALVSGVFLNEVLTFRQWWGLALILVATVVIASTRFNKKTLAVDRYTVVALASAVFLGVAFSNEKYLLDNMNLASYFVVGWGFQTLVMIVFAKNYFHQAIPLLKTSPVPIAVLGVCRGLAGLCLVYALNTSDNSSLISAIMSYKTVLVVAGSYVILKERDYLFPKLVGTALATGGLLLLL